MPTIDQFIEKYLGQSKGYPTDSAYKGQCLSICKIYIKECFGIDPPASGSGSAYGYWSNFPNPLGTKFKKVPNTPDLIPEYGWIVIWKPWSANQYGHIALVDKGCTKTVLKNIAQNWTNRTFRRESQSYTNVVGFLVPLQTNSNSMIEIEKKVFEELVTKSTRLDEIAKLGYDSPLKIKELIENLEKERANATNWKSEAVEKSSILDQVKKEFNTFTETLASKLATIIDKNEIIGAVDRLLDNERTLQKNVTQLEKAYSLLESEKKEEITSLKEAIATMKAEYEKALERVEKLENRVRELEGKDKVSETEKDVFTGIERLINIIKELFKKEK